MRSCNAASPAWFWPVLWFSAAASSFRPPADEAAALQGDTLPAQAIWLEGLDLSRVSQGWDTAKAAHSMDNHPIKIHGATFAHGIGTHAESQMNVDLKGVATRFVSMVGIDDETGGKGKVRFLVVVDGKPVADSGTMLGNQPATLLSADLRGAKRLALLVVVPSDKDNTDNCHADWAGARLELSAGATVKPATIDGSEDPNVPGPLCRRWPAKILPGRRSTTRTSPARRRAARSFFSCRPRVSRRCGSRPATCRRD